MKTTRTLAIVVGCVLALVAQVTVAQEATLASQKSTNTKSRKATAKRKNTRAAPRATEVKSEPTPPLDPKPTSQDDKAAPESAEPAKTPEAKPAVETSDNAPQEGAEKETTEDVEQPSTDPLIALREEAEAAESPVEKTRVRMQIVDLLVTQGRQSDAINELRSISFEDHFDPQGLYNVGNALARLGDADGAIAAYTKAIEQRKGRYTRALNNLGVLLLRQGRWDEAYNSFMSALRLENFRYAEASYNLGRLYAARGEMDLAVREWRRALVVNPDHKAAAQALANAGEQNRVSVVNAIKPPKVMAAPKSDSADSTVVRPSKAMRTPAEHGSLTVDAETYDYLQRARASRDRDRQEDAVLNYRRVLSRMGGYFAPANLELGYSLVTLKRMDEAIEALLPVTTHDGQRYPISYYHLARLYEARGDLKLAEENFNRAATYYRKDNAQFLLDVSRVREKLEDYEGALSVLEEYLATIEQKNVKPSWSEERLTSLKQRIAANQKKP